VTPQERRGFWLAAAAGSALVVAFALWQGGGTLQPAAFTLPAKRQSKRVARQNTAYRPSNAPSGQRPATNRPNLWMK
jgi:hypothetical protein